MAGADGRSPLTLGTAGHVDHGKTALVGALTGVDTDRLPEEKQRGLSIDLGYAPLALPSGRRLSLVDVPGHQRFVRTMVAGATGIDCFLLTVAADDGVMPQTREHARVLSALGVGDGVVAVTKSDAADPARAIAEARVLVPAAEAVAVSAREGTGMAELVDALERMAARLPGRGGQADGEPRLHVDRSFTVKGAGTVVTGTLWSGAVARGDHVALAGRAGTHRVRAVHLHGEEVERAEAGQRVALNLVGLSRDQVSRGDVVAGPDTALRPTRSLVADLALDEEIEDGERVQVHHGTRESPARIRRRAEGGFGVRLEQLLLADAGDRLVVRRIAPPGTLGGGTVRGPPPGARPPGRAGVPAARGARRARPAHRRRAGVGAAPLGGRPRRRRGTASWPGWRPSWRRCATTGGWCGWAGRSTSTPRWSTRSRPGSGRTWTSSPTSPSRSCATSWAPAAGTPRRCWSTSTPRA